MKKGYLVALILLMSCCMVLTVSSQELVAWTVYVHEGDLNGTMLSNVQVTGQDAAGNSFQGITDSNGVVVISGQPGAWQFSFDKEGYDPLDLYYNVTETGEGAIYLQDWRHKYSMEYEETYHGQRIIVTTLQQPEGDWKSKAELLDSGKRILLGKTSDDRYPSEEEAKRAALSIAAGAIDRTRISKGKP
jgi:hypothetical protein